MSRYGSRFTDGGYQAPTTSAAALERGRPARELTWIIGTVRATLRLVPLLHGRPELWEVEYQTNDVAAARTVYNPCIIRGDEHARQAFALTAAELDVGRIPDNVIVPAGTPLGP